MSLPIDSKIKKRKLELQLDMCDFSELDNETETDMINEMDIKLEKQNYPSVPNTQSINNRQTVYCDNKKKFKNIEFTDWKKEVWAQIFSSSYEPM